MHESRGEVRRAVAYGVALFVATRVVLTLLALLGRAILEHKFGAFYPRAFVYSRVAWLDVWGLWDTGWYLGIARHGYPTGGPLDPAVHAHARFGFFPLYPWLIRGVAVLTTQRFFAALIVSNAALVASGVFLYKLVRLDADEATARRSLKYLLLFPSGFVLGAAFADSLLLALSLAAFYAIRTGRVAAAGGAGFLLALAKSTGVFFALPIAWEWWRARGGRIDPSCLWLALFPAGLACFALLCHLATGDWLAFSHVKADVWHVTLRTPVETLTTSIQKDKHELFAWIAMGLVALLLVLGARRLRPSYLAAALLILLLSLSGGPALLTGIPRYAAALFPFAILFAELGREESWDQLLTVTLALLQGGLVILWSSGLFII